MMAFLILLSLHRSSLLRERKFIHQSSKRQRAWDMDL